MSISQHYLKDALNYDPDTGAFTWRKRPREHFANDGAWKAFNTRDAGNEAGSYHHSYPLTYRFIRISGVNYRAHRLAWLYMHGRFPKDQLDHQDGDGCNNQLSNLREVSNRENHRNTSRPTNNTSGVVGVSWQKQGGKWGAQIKVDGHKIHLGSFASKSEAIAARAAANIKYNFHQNHGRSCTESPTPTCL